MSRLRHVSTVDLLRLARQRPDALGCGCGGRCAPCRARVGEGGGWLDWAADQLDQAVQRGQKLLLDAGSAPARYVYGGMMAAAADMREVAEASVRRGASTLGEIGTELSSRMAAAAERYLAAVGSGLASVGKGLGKGWESILGFKVGEGAILFGLGALLLAGGAGWLLLTPGGQKLLVGGGQLAGGAGTALAKAL